MGAAWENTKIVHGEKKPPRKSHFLVGLQLKLFSLICKLFCFFICLVYEISENMLITTQDKVFEWSCFDHNCEDIIQFTVREGVKKPEHVCIKLASTH